MFEADGWMNRATSGHDGNLGAGSDVLATARAVRAPEPSTRSRSVPTDAGRRPDPSPAVCPSRGPAERDFVIQITWRSAAAMFNGVTAFPEARCLMSERR